jgi:hypothetical protein
MAHTGERREKGKTETGYQPSPDAEMREARLDEFLATLASSNKVAD